MSRALSAALSAVLPARRRTPTHAPMPWAARAFLRLLRQMPVGTVRVRLPDGQWTVCGQGSTTPSAELHLHAWPACAAILRSGDIGFGEAWRQGWIDSPDPTALLHLALANEAALTRAIHGGWWARVWHHLRHRLRANTRRGSARNIHAHYDIGNPFYALWLDRTWTYSSAWFQGDLSRPLEQAQAAKYQRIIDVLGLRPGDCVLEIGCGWGGFAEHAARLGLEVYGVTISQAQWAFARQRLQAQGLDAHARLELVDYRDLPVQGRTYDAVVSIEMFEAVGEAHWAGYFDTVRACLRPGGRALIQSITINEQHFERYRAGSDFIQQMVFPGGMLPSAERFEAAAERAGLQARGAFRFGRDYAETLRRWRAGFEAQRHALPGLGLDDAFARVWQLYLCYCEAGFDAGRIDVAQFHLQG